MSRLKQRTVLAALVLFSIWPVVQIALVKAYDVNPWKLAAWGMYSAPQIPAELQLYRRTGAGAYEAWNLPATAVPVARRFLQRRLGLGQLAQPRALGEALLHEWPDATEVKVDVIQPKLDPTSGMIRDETSSFAYER